MCAKKSSEPSTPVTPGTPVDEDAIQIIPGPLSPIAKPLCDEKLSKRVVKMVRKAAKSGDLSRGAKEVAKAIRDVSPMDVISHFPVLCEETGNPYIFVRSKMELGLACRTKCPTCCIMICPEKKGDYYKYYEEVYDKIKELSLI